MKKYRYYTTIFMLMLMMMVFASSVPAAETQSVNKDNWQVLKGIMPESALKWVQTGEMVVKYGKLDYDPGKVQPSWVLESLKENVGKYKLTAKKAIVEDSTGKSPKFIKGVPFPGVKITDPDGAEKVMWNTLYIRDVNGPLKTKMDVKFIGRRTGYERSIYADWYSKPFDGYEPAKAWSNPDNLEAENQIVVTSPYDMAGTAMMTWRYRTDKNDMLFGYVPAIRRVRQMTPAGRSDALFGSDFARDDGAYGGYDGNINNFKWKIIGEGEVVGGFIGSKPVRVNQNKNGEWVFDYKNKELLVWSYEKKGQPGYSAAPWHVDSLVWTKRPVWIIEGIPKDTYYNYGKQIIYVDKEINIAYWKVIYDRTGNYWKTLWFGWGMGQDETKTVNLISMPLQIIVDERSKHATVQLSTMDYKCGGALDSNQFSLGGFTAICK
jgi:hypothetical protein